MTTTTSIRGCITTEHSVSEVKCRDCGHRQAFRDEGEAALYRTQHEARHVASRQIGPTLEGRVLDVGGPGVPWFGVIHAAEEYAKSAGLAYFSWNGFVYLVGAIDFNAPICYTQDVPGLTP